MSKSKPVATLSILKMKKDDIMIAQAVEITSDRFEYIAEVQTARQATFKLADSALTKWKRGASFRQAIAKDCEARSARHAEIIVCAPDGEVLFSWTAGNPL